MLKSGSQQTNLFYINQGRLHLDNFYARTNGFVSEMVRACQGSTGAQQNISLLIGQIMRDDATKPLGQSLMQIVVGERDRALLTRNLEGEPLWLINRILDELASSNSQDPLF